MSKWNLVSLKEIVNNLDNKRVPLNSSQRELKESKPLYPYIGANNIMGYIDEYIFDEKILCIAEDGGSWGYNQRCAVLYNEKVWVNNHAHVITAKENLVLEYLMYYLNHTDLNLYINGATRGKLTKSSLESIKIPLPPLPQQQKIANILDSADAIKQNDKALIAKYDELTQALFLDMFGDPLKNNLNLPFSKIRELTNVSQGMQIAIKERHKESGPNRYKYLTVAYLNGRKEEEYIESPRASVICNKEEILMIRTGNTGQVVTNVEGVFHNNFFKIDWDKKRLNKNYLVYFLSNPGIRRDLLKRASTTTIPDLSHSQFYDINIILPPIEMQNQFAERVQAIEVQKAKAQASLEKAEELFNSLLQRAFKGELFIKSRLLKSFLLKEKHLLK